jgi:NAD(P)-dependent dehydrogenase (short-subunit alcohol dehydrogenase family)
LNFGAFLELVRNFSKKKFLGTNPSIVGVSSVMASAGQPGRVLYSASKGALEAAVRSMSLELAGSGIRVNAVAPGVVNTELIQKAVKEMGDEWIQKQIIEQPLGLLDTLDVAQVVMFLLSDATLKVTGSVWAVDAGYTAR